FHGARSVGTTTGDFSRRELLTSDWGHPFQTIQSMPSDVPPMKQSTGSEWSSMVRGMAKMIK
ncbi:hypothetical protein, partial [Pseudomonas gingeri]